MYLRTLLKAKKVRWAIGMIVLILILLFCQKPLAYDDEKIIRIPSGTTVQEISILLAEEEVIASSQVFSFIARITQDGRRIQAGQYIFDQPLTAHDALRRLVVGEYGFAPFRVLIPEGIAVREMVPIFEREIPEFDTETFLKLAIEKEGYLFPDTYFFLPSDTPETIIQAMQDRFNEVALEIEEQRIAFGKPLEQVVTLASIVEEEGITTEDRRIIAGILWKRLEIGMPLQVDATFQYINGKASLELTLDDLEIDSPYNTYEYRGLPPGPITNPGLDSLLATITPIESDYLFYLSDSEETIHYAEDFEEHKVNKAKYLR